MLAKPTVALAVLLALPACASGPRPADETRVLPLRTVRLYETGIGYFERSGEISGEAGLPVPATHLDDALKTLVVFGPDGQSLVSGIEYSGNASPEMARALAGLSADARAPLGYRELLLSLKGAPVEARTSDGERLRGRIVDVAMRSPAPPSDPDAEPGTVAAANGPLEIVLLTEESEVRRLASEQLLSLRPSDEALAARLQAALDSSTARAHARRLVRVLASTEGPISLAYVAEAPLWRTTYRLVLDPANSKAVLQGWALLHNDTDEDWRGVKVELVNGRPDSFLFPLAAPRYARRPLVTPENALSTVPQLLDTTVDAMWSERDESVEGLGLALIGSGGGGFGSIGIGGIATSGRGGGFGDASVEQAGEGLGIANLAETAAAEGLESGSLFIYRLPSALDLSAHASALVPFAQGAIEARPIDWIEQPGSMARAGVELANDTRQTLPEGTLAAFSDGGLAGETTLDRLKPGERRFLTFGSDLDVSLDVVPGSVRSSEQPKKVTFRDGVLTEQLVRTTESRWRLQNRGGAARTLCVGLKALETARVQGADEVGFDSQRNRPVARIALAAGADLEKPIVIEEAVSRKTKLAKLTVARLEALAAASSLSEQERAVIQEALERQRGLDELRKARKKTSDALKEAKGDLGRLRKDLQALGDGAAKAANHPFVQRVLAAEDQIVALRKQGEAQDEEIKAKAQALKGTLEKLPPQGS